LQDLKDQESDLKSKLDEVKHRAKKELD